MEDNPNVGNLRAATAVFRFDEGKWQTDGRAIFKMGPAGKAIEVNMRYGATDRIARRID